MPADARADYERLRAAREDETKLAYRAPDPAFTSAPDLSGTFRAAGIAATTPAAMTGETAAPPADRRPPV